MKLIDNKKLHLTYTTIENLEAGIELFGFEVKALRSKLGNLDGAKVIVRGGEVYVVGIYIPPFQAANTPKSYDPYRTRRLLLKQKEIIDLYDRDTTKGLTMHPSSLYIKHNLIKCEVSVCKKKNMTDKREDLKKTIARREMRE